MSAPANVQQLYRQLPLPGQPRHFWRELGYIPAGLALQTQKQNGIDLRDLAPLPPCSLPSLVASVRKANILSASASSSAGPTKNAVSPSVRISFNPPDVVVIRGTPNARASNPTIANGSSSDGRTTTSATRYSCAGLWKKTRSDNPVPDTALSGQLEHAPVYVWTR